MLSRENVDGGSSTFAVARACFLGVCVFLGVGAFRIVFSFLFFFWRRWMCDVGRDYFRPRSHFRFFLFRIVFFLVV